jgi:lycopene cyclase domain-containing protein
MKFLYLFVDFFTVLIPLVFSFHPKIQFYKRWKEFLIAAIFAAVIFITWDAVFTSLKVWNFNKNYITGIYFLNLPIEEVLFFFCIPFSCVFTFYCLNKFYRLSWNSKVETIFCLILSFLLLIAGLIFLNKIYTSVTFISTALICILLKFVFKINWFGKAISVYAILIVPFMIVNGILTGTGLQAPVVQYNKIQILNIYLFTIPVEDVFYGLELFLLNLFIYQLLIPKNDEPIINGMKNKKEIVEINEAK